MKTIKRLAALIMPPFVLAGCVGASVVSESKLPAHQAKVSSLLIVMDSSVFAGEQFHGNGKPYLAAMADVLRDQAGNIPVTVVTVDPMSLENDVGRAIIANKPSQIMVVHTVSLQSNRYGPVSATWQLDIEDVSQHSVVSNGAPTGQTSVSRRPIYRVRVSGLTCMGLLSIESVVRGCGAKVGQTFVDRLREAHVMTPNIG